MYVIYVILTEYLTLFVLVYYLNLVLLNFEGGLNFGLLVTLEYLNKLIKPRD